MVDTPVRLVFVGAPGSGKTTVVNRVLASLLDERSGPRAETTRVLERETLSRPHARAEIMTMEARVREEYREVCLSPDGRRALAVVEANPDPNAVLPDLPTAWNVEVRDAPKDADFHVRVTVTYADELELESLISKARRAFGLSSGPSSHQNEVNNETDASQTTDEGDSSGSFLPVENSKKKKSTTKGRPRNPPKTLTPLEHARVCSILGCAGDNGALRDALHDRTRAYLPLRFRDLLGSRRAVDWRGPSLSASLQAARVGIARLCGFVTSRVGLLRLGTVCTVEVPLTGFGKQSVFVDTPGDVSQNHLSRKMLEHALSTTLHQNLDALLVVSDGGKGPCIGLHHALASTNTFRTMLGRVDGAAFVLLWPLDRLGQFDATALDFTSNEYAEAQLAKVRSKETLTRDDFFETVDKAQSPFRGASGRNDTTRTAIGVGPLAGDGDTSNTTPTTHSWLSLIDRAALSLGDDVRGVVALGVKTWWGKVHDDELNAGDTETSGTTAESLSDVVAFVVAHAVGRWENARARMGDNASHAPFTRIEKRLPILPEAVPSKTNTNTNTNTNTGNPFAFESPSSSPARPVVEVGPEVGPRLVSAKRKLPVAEMDPAPALPAVPVEKKKVRFAKHLVEETGEPAANALFKNSAKHKRKPLLDISKNGGGKAATPRRGWKSSSGDVSGRTTTPGDIASVPSVTEVPIPPLSRVPNWRGDNASETPEKKKLSAKKTEAKETAKGPRRRGKNSLLFAGTRK